MRCVECKGVETLCLVQTEDRVENHGRNCGRKGDNIEPHLLEALKDSFDFYRSIAEEDTFELLMNQSWRARCEWLTENASTILLRDKDWDKIFTDIEENEMSFSRYYPMVRVKADSRDLVYMIIALVLNDDLYDYCIQKYNNREFLN